MPTILGFAPGAFEALSGASDLTAGTRFRLPPEWEASEDHYEFDITDADATFQGDAGDDANEVGDDSTQDGTVRDAQGNLIASGQFYLEDVRTFTDPEGNTINLYRVEITGSHVGWIADGELKAGVVYEVSSDGNVSDATAPVYTDIVDANFDEDDANSILGSGFDETLISGDNADSIDGGDGDDEIYAGADDDTIYGGCPETRFLLQFEVESVPTKETDYEEIEVQRGADHCDPEAARERRFNRRCLPGTRDQFCDLLQVEGQVRRHGCL